MLDNIKHLSRADSLSKYLQIFEALHIMFTNGYVHNDIKPSNIMSDKNINKIYLIDFGLS